MDYLNGAKFRRGAFVGREIERASDDRISNFHYEFVEKITGFDSMSLTNESSLYDFSDKFDRRSREDKKRFFYEKINEVFGLDVSDVPGDDCNVVVLGNEVRRRLDPRA